MSRNPDKKTSFFYVSKKDLCMNKHSSLKGSLLFLYLVLSDCEADLCVGLLHIFSKSVGAVVSEINT